MAMLVYRRVDFYDFFPQNHRSSPSRYPLCQGHCGPAPVGSILHTCLVIEGCKSLHNLNLKDGQVFYAEQDVFVAHRLGFSY